MNKLKTLTLLQVLNAMRTAALALLGLFLLLVFVTIWAANTILWLRITATVFMVFAIISTLHQWLAKPGIPKRPTTKP